MDLANVLSDKPLPMRTENTESATDDKAVDTTTETVKTDAAPSAAIEPEAKVETKVETSVDDSARDDKGRFQKTVPHEALHAQRLKTQALEAELAKLREVKPPVSVLEDEDAAFASRLDAATRPLREQLFSLSVETARSRPGREDYDEVTAEFIDATDKDPELKKNWLAARNPGEFAYTVGKQIKELSGVGGDILQYGEKKKAEGAAEAAALKTQLAALQAEVATLKESKDKQARVPQSLNAEQSAASRDQSFSGPRPLNAILS
jgi:hypothetical protein